MGRARTQLSVNGKLCIPLNKPKVATILRVTTTPVIDKTVVGHRVVIFIGHIRVCMEYAAYVPAETQPIHFVSFALPFKAIVNYRRARPGLRAYVKTKVLFQEFHLLDPNTIKKMIVLQLKIRKMGRIKKWPPVCCLPSGEGCQPVHPVSQPYLQSSCCGTQILGQSGEKTYNPVDCKQEVIFPVCEEEPDNLSFTNKSYHNDVSRDLDLYGKVYLPTSIQPLAVAGAARGM
ncbi:MAG: hypothetical protein H6Q72_3286 [Firmicutes bacterium]|nr:hypothetical protein [Bacillota bacterium]